MVHLLQRGLALLTLLLPGAPVLAEQSLRLVGDEFCPYNCEAEGQKQGYMIDLLREVFAAQGFEVEYRTVPWSRAIRMVQGGDAEVLIANTEHNTPAADLQLLLGEDSTCFFTRADSAWRYSDMQDLQQQRLGVIQGYHYDDTGPLDAHIKSGSSLVHIASGETALQNSLSMLQKGRIDVVPENCNVGRYNIRKLGLEQQLHSAGQLPGYRAGLYVSFSPALAQSLQWLEQLRAGVEAMRSSGQLALLLEKYAVNDWVEAQVASTEAASVSR
jgi:polar amino acid transport system substrate-binding protein